MMELLSRIRFLPVTIFAAALMLTIKLSSIWEEVDGLNPPEPALSVAQALAQQNPPAAAEAPAGDSAPAPAAESEPLDSASNLDDPTLLTQAEIDLLQQLAERRDTLERREREIDMRTELLQAAEQRIDDKVAELKTLEQTIQNLIKTYDDQQESKLSSLVKIYENMKPKQAAKIFEELEMDTLLDVVERMNERRLAPIMAVMNPIKATEITVELRRLRELPQPGTENPLARTGG